MSDSNRLRQLEQAFTAYVNDQHPNEPPVIGFCNACGFPVWINMYGSMAHYTPQGPQSRPLCCKWVSFNLSQEQINEYRQRGR